MKILSQITRQQTPATAEMLANVSIAPGKNLRKPHIRACLHTRAQLVLYLKSAGYIVRTGYFDSCG